VTDFQTASNDLRWLARRLAGVLALADEFDRLGGMASAIDALEKRKAVLEADVSALAQANDRAETDRKYLAEKAAEVAQAKIDDAKAEAAKMIEAAGIRIADLVSAAEARAGSLAAQATADEAKIAALDERMKGLDDAIAAREAALADVEAKIEAAREAARKIMGS
jgi:chromosome segregation ATPase